MRTTNPDSMHSEQGRAVRGGLAMLRRMLILAFGLLVTLPVIRVAGQDGFGAGRDDEQAQSAQHSSLPGRVIGDLNLRTVPAVTDETFIRTLQHNDPVEVLESVVGDDGDEWYRVGESAFVHAADVRVPSPSSDEFSGRWV